MDVLSRKALRTSVRMSVVVALSSPVLAGCIGVSPEQAEADALGPDTGGYSSGPLHRAGFPCTRCHGDQWWQQSPSFELAGTVYRRPSDRDGMNGVEVIVEDAAGHELSARTNRTGNFYFLRDGSTPALEYPLRVRVRAGGAEQAMRGAIWREQSCATCHRGPANEENNGRIFVEESAP